MAPLYSRIDTEPSTLNPQTPLPMRHDNLEVTASAQLKNDYPDIVLTELANLLSVKADFIKSTDHVALIGSDDPTDKRATLVRFNYYNDQQYPATAQVEILSIEVLEAMPSRKEYPGCMVIIVPKEEPNPAAAPAAAGPQPAAPAAQPTAQPDANATRAAKAAKKASAQIKESKAKAAKKGQQPKV